VRKALRTIRLLITRIQNLKMNLMTNPKKLPKKSPLKSERLGVQLRGAVLEKQQLLLAPKIAPKLVRSYSGRVSRLGWDQELKL
jgi:hypothetical protein